MADKDSDEFMKSTARDHEVDGKEDPREIASLESSTEPERNDLLLVELTPDIKDRQHHRVHEQLEVRWINSYTDHLLLPR